MTPKIRVLVAEDHLIARVGVTAIINMQADMKVVAEAVASLLSSIESVGKDVRSGESTAHSDAASASESMMVASEVVATALRDERMEGRENQKRMEALILSFAPLLRKAFWIGIATQIAGFALIGAVLYEISHR